MHTKENGVYRTLRKFVVARKDFVEKGVLPTPLIFTIYIRYMILPTRYCYHWVPIIYKTVPDTVIIGYR